MMRGLRFTHPAVITYYIYVSWAPVPYDYKLRVFKGLEFSDLRVVLSLVVLLVIFWLTHAEPH